MKTIDELLSHLSSLDVKLWTEKISENSSEVRLRCNAPKDVFTSDLKTELAQRKAEILEFLLQLNLTATPIKPFPRTGNIPLSFAQQRLWFLDRLEPGNSFYNQPAALRLIGELKIDILEQSLREIIRRHEVLRTNFAIVATQTVQVINLEVDFQLTVIDITNLSPTEKEREIAKLAQQEEQKPFNLERDLLLRVTLVKCKAQEHIILFTTHHIVSDDWSTSILIQEIGTLYQAFVEGKLSPLPELPIQYADFAIWQREWLKGHRLNTQLNYWKQQLGNNSSLLNLPTDYSRPSKLTYQGATQSFVLDKSLTKVLKTLAKKEGVTLFMLLIAAFKLLLHRYSNQEEITIGTAIANRNHAEIENLIGFFVNTLVLRTKCDRNSSFLDLLKQVKDVTLGAYSHQDLPFEQLVEELKPERHLNRNPLFDVMFTLQNAPESKLTLPGLTLSPIEEEGRSTIFDLSIDMFESDSGLKGILQYSTDLFESSTIQRMLGHFQILLKAIVSQPKTSLSELSLLTEEEKQQVLYQWNNNQAEYPVDRCIHTLFEEQVNQTPDAVAAVFKDCSLTYRQLNEQANQLARCLQNCGLVTGEFVGIYQGRSLSFLISILAILKVGAVYIPMDNTYPFERIEYMLSNSQVRFLLADSQCSKILLDSSQDHTELKYLICLDSLAAKKSKHLTILGRESWQNLSTVNPAITQTGSDPAYMIYTSGSTGVPKGTIIRHGGAINHIYAQYDALNLNSDLTFLQSAPASSDISVWQFLAPLLTGGKTIIIDTETVCNSEQLFQVIQQSNITLVELVPVVLRGLINYLSSLSLEARKLPSLQWMMVTGESVSVDLVNQWLKLYPTIPIVNAYGPSEASDDITQAIINRPLADNQNTVTIGKPLANLNLHILDSNLQLLPIGIPGEICVSGYGVGIGYWQNEAKTQKNFIPNPFPETAKPLPGVETDLLYKTGDLGRWLPDGSIEYLGRIDNQVKIRGFRIELEEIETVIARHPLISDCVVIDRGDNLRDKRLIAYYIAPQTLEVKQLREFLKSKLPDYMIPAAWMQLDAFPLTPNGKCDRNALPTPDFALTTTNYIAPRTPQEEILANIWQEVLNIDKVGIDDNFFELGGHSLLATQVVSKIRHSLSVELPLRSLFEFPTVAELTYQLQGISLTELPSIQPVARDGYLPLSFAQQRLWFLAQLEPDSPAYNIPEVLRLQGRLDINVLTETLTAIIQRHEVFRTTFTIVAGEPVQVIKPTVDFRLPIIDLVSLPKAIQEQEVKKLTEQEALKAFDLARDSLLRVTLIRFDDLEHIILFTMHHIISDGWSTGILVQEVTTLYQAFLEGKPSPLPKLSIQYADYAVWQREWLQGDILEAQLSYWQSKLGGELPILKLPIANPQLNVRTFRGGQQSLIIAKALSDELKNLSIKHGVTLFMTLLAAFQTLLHWYTDGEDIIIGTDIANRHQSETENLIGFFVNQLVLRNDFSGNPNFQELLTRTRQVTLDAYANQDLPFDKLVEVLNPKRSLSHQPLFQVKMILQNTPISSLELPDLKISSIDLDKKIAEYDLLLDLEDTEIGLNGLLKYDADLFKANKIAEFIKNFKLILSTIAQQPKLKLSELKAILNQAAEQQNQSQRDEYQVTLTRNLGKVQRKSLI